MKHIIIITALLIASCNPIGYIFSEKVTVSVSSDQINTEFKCAKESAEIAFDMFKKSAYNKGDCLQFKKVGLKMWRDGDIAKLRITWYDYQIGQSILETEYNSLIYNKILEETKADTILLTNAEVRY